MKRCFQRVPSVLPTHMVYTYAANRYLYSPQPLRSANIIGGTNHDVRKGQIEFEGFWERKKDDVCKWDKTSLFLSFSFSFKWKGSKIGTENV